MRKLKEFWMSLPETVTFTRREGVLIVTISTLIGIILGMLCSPRKDARYGCNNGNTVIHNWADEDLPEADNETI